MQVTITGGTGNVAEYLIRELEGKYDLVLFDRVKPGENRFNFDVRHPVVVGDLLDIEACERAMAGSQAVVHLAAIPYPTEHPEVRARIQSQGLPTPAYDETVRVNMLGTYYVLEAARRQGVKTVVAASSNCVLGHIFRFSDVPFPIKYLPMDEQHPFDYEDTYSLSKYVNEETMRAFSRAYGMRCYAIRPAAVQRIDRQIEYARSYKALDNWNMAMNGYVDIRDIARAFRMCLEASDTFPPFDAFFVNAADTFSLEDTRALIERLRPNLAHLATGLVGRQSMISAAKAERAFGFRAEHSWTEHLQK